MYGVEGIRGVSASAVAMGAAASILMGLPPASCMRLLVKSAADLISPEAPNYSQVAARLNILKSAKMPSVVTTIRTSTNTLSER